ncbi:SAP family cell cycle dependent phosphatase-associated protein [Handroanthus impetiginosus]|uniref:SAP family cell cycle dependent phosphatase-associated protein n=1 Tax=Handroanthus impetiginosus TaxID=429701 RepID=A0A2G9GPW5_9LAMI|nr:SAP family cell cycle dependent phosphatase-associated protein [Handroanthus impetiginosus]
MFWRMAGLSTASPVETILDKENFTLEELLDEDEIIQECKALNGRLINFLRERDTVKKLIQYTVEEAPEDAERQRTFKFPFIACEIFTCEVDIILKALVDDEELMDMLFSFLNPERPHSTLLAGYFSKVVVCLLLRKTTSLMNYIRAHPDIIRRLVDLIGITSIMEVLIRLIGADEHIYANYAESMQWLDDMNVLEMIVDKFSSSDCAEVHANAAETLCAITRYAPPGLASKISSPSFIGRLFRHALENSRPKSVLVNLLTVCISMLDPKRLTSGTYYMYTRQMAHGSGSAANPETVQGMLESLGDLLKLLDISSEEQSLPTTYGKLQPPLGKHRLKIIEFISVLVAVSSEVAEKELIRLGAVKHILELFFEYPYNNFLHHHVEHIVNSCLESKNPQFVEHLLCDCNLIERILEAEKNFTLAVNISTPTIPAEGRAPPRIGNLGHLTRIANKLVQLGNSNAEIQKVLQENNDWVDWQTNVLVNRNAVENVFQWACGRPTALQDRTRDSDDDDYQDRDYDVAALANNLSQAFRYGIYSNDDMGEAHGSLERDDEDVYFDDESAEVVISSLRLGDDQESGSLFTNSNWFAFEDERIANEHSSGSITSSSPNIEGRDGVAVADDDVIVEGAEDLADTATSEPPEQKTTSNDDVPSKPSEGFRETETSVSDKPAEWVEWRESSDSTELPPASNSANTANATQPPSLPNGELQVQVEGQPDIVGADKNVATPTSAVGPADNCMTEGGASPDSKEINSGSNPLQTKEAGEGNCSIEKVESNAGTEDSSGPAECKEQN